MSDSNSISLRRKFFVRGTERTFQLAVSAFMPTNVTHVANADPALVLQGTNQRPGSKREFVGDELKNYRLNRMIDQDDLCPIVIPTVSVMNDGPILFDADLVKAMVERGVRQIPFALIGDKEAAQNFAVTFNDSENKIVKEDLKNMEDLNNEHENSGLSLENFTTMMCMEELISSVDSHVTMRQSRMSEDFSSAKEGFYDYLPSCQDMLDGMIAMGIQSIDVHHYWKGESLYEGIKNAIQQQAQLIEGQGPSAIELVDRFSLLHERMLAREKLAKQSYTNLIDASGETIAYKSARKVAEMMNANPESLELSATQLSPAALTYLANISDTSPSYRPEVTHDKI